MPSPRAAGDFKHDLHDDISNMTCRRFQTWPAWQHSKHDLHDDISNM